MPDRLLLVPGTGGTTLKADGADFGFPFELGIATNFWHQIFDEKMTAAVGTKLTMDYVDDIDVHTAKRTTLDKAITRVHAGVVLRETAYKLLPESIELFAYDWRQDIRQSATELIALLKSKAPATGRWRLTCHSQGGLVTLVAARMMAVAARDRAAFAQLVSRVVFVGVPVLGTVNAAEALVKGNFLTWVPPVGGGPSPITKAMLAAVRSWPSLYQMLPAWQSVLRDAPAGVSGDNLFDARAWGAFADDPDAPVRPALLARAKKTYDDYFVRPFRNLQGVGLSLFMASNTPTNTFTHYAAAGLEIPDAKRVGGRGDSLVPVETVQFQTRDQLSNDHFVTFENANEHSRLFMDPAISTALAQGHYLGSLS